MNEASAHILEDPTATREPLSVRLRGLLRGDLAVLLVLIVLNLLCYHRSLRGYFLADDFIHIPYLVKVFDGHPELLWQNFYGNWLQAQGTQFYRPLISITLALDYALGGANPLIYHVTNLFFQIASSMFLFLVVRLLFGYRSEAEKVSIAFLAAAFFSVCPLHPEVVSWVIGRVDSVCTAFLLASFWFYLRGNNNASKFNQIASLLFFVLSLLSKEMAVTLPPVLWLHEFLRAPGKPSDQIRAAFKRSAPYWAGLAIYIVVRTAALGTISGGYAGSIGSSLTESIWRRFFQDGSFMHVLFPLNAEIGSAHRLVHILLYLYSAALFMAFVRSLIMLLDNRFKQYCLWICFAMGWFVISMLPTYQVWNLTPALLGSRFIYLGSAPLCLLLALLVAPIGSMFDDRSGRLRLWTFAHGALSCALIWCFADMTSLNNNVWVTAGRHLQAFREGIAKYFADHTCAAVAVLNLPERYKGAHMLYNGAMLSVLLRPPLSTQDYTDQVFSFEPATFGDADLLNASRLRRMLRTQRDVDYLAWDDESGKLNTLHLVAAGNEKQLPGSDLSTALSPYPVGLISPALDEPSLASDFVDISLAASGKPGGNAGAATLLWNSSSSPFFSTNQELVAPMPKSNRFSFCVSEHKKWIAAASIHQVKLELPSGSQLKSLKTVSGADQIPVLEPLPNSVNSGGRKMAEDKMGICRPGKEIGKFSVDASGIPGAKSIAVQISQADSFFEHYSGTFRDTEIDQEHSSFVKKIDGIKLESASIPTKVLSKPGFYELRAFALDGAGKVIGSASDPLVLQFSAADVSQ